MMLMRSLLIATGVETKMAKTDTTTTRAPRGAKPVSQAFFTALESIPEATRAAVAKAAQAMIRDQIKTQREKVKAIAAKDKAAAANKARQSAPIKAVTTAPKAASKTKTKSETEAVPAKRRVKKPSKPADVPAAA